MVDITAGEAGDESRQIAKHEMIAAPGGAHTADIAASTGIRYTDKSSGQAFEYIMPLPKAVTDKGLTIDAFKGTAILMFALFGAKTKATNETSRVRQRNGTSEDQLEALDDVFGGITDGVWREKAEGGGGSRTDKGLLATVLVEMLGTRAQGDAAHYAARFESDVTYMRKVLASDAGTEYKKRRGKVVAVDDLA